MRHTGRIMKRKTWPLVLGVILVGALAGLALGGRPTTLPAVVIPAATSTTLTASSSAVTTVAPTATPTVARTTAVPTTSPTSSTSG